MAGTTRVIEGIELDSRTNLCCPRCLRFSLTEVRVGIVDADTLELLCVRTGSECTNCGAAD